MKTSLFSFAAALALLATTGSITATAADHENKYERREADRRDKDFNYGYDRRHKVTASERARWEAAQRRQDNYRGAQQSAAQRNRMEDQHEADRRNDRNDKEFNYGYDRSHRVSAAECARWEATHRNGQRNGRR